MMSVMAASPQTSDQKLTQLLNAAAAVSFSQRVDQLSGSLLNLPYVAEPLGEGPTGEYNQEPLYRFDAFDCQTYVSTVLALALAKSPAEFKNYLQKINYKNGDISFVNRTHFADADWAPNNIKQGFIKEITADVAGKNNVEMAETYLNRKNWYKHLDSDRIKISNLTVQQQTEKLQNLRAQAEQVENQSAKISYIPMTILFSAGQPNLQLFNKIPSDTIVLFIYQNPALVKKVGTAINVSHMGFIIRKNGTLYLRTASSLYNETIDLPFIRYLQAYLTNPKMKGIALFVLATPESLRYNKE